VGLGPLLLLGGRDRSPNRSTQLIANILAADEKRYDSIAAFEGTAVGVCPDQKIVTSTVWQKSSVRARAKSANLLRYPENKGEQFRPSIPSYVGHHDV
jgi:hypothetical protein